MEGADEGRAVVVVLAGGREVARWPLERTPGGDLAAVDELARLQLAAARCGWRVRVVAEAGDRLRELIELAGLTDVLVDRGRPS